jgi:hypothetical protein
MSPVKPKELREMKAWIDANRQAATSYDYVVEGETPGDNVSKARRIIRPYLNAGATWWIESMWSEQDLGQVLERIRQGPAGL